jgi:cytochrome c2
MWPGESRRQRIGVGLALLCAAAAASVVFAWSSQRTVQRVARAITGGDPTRASEILRRYGCSGCHSIPGIAGANGVVGPPLSGLIHRVYIGGVATNSPDNLVQWIVSPQSLSPQSAMPATGISEAEGREVAAYLYAH